MTFLNINGYKIEYNGNFKDILYNNFQFFMKIYPFIMGKKPAFVSVKLHNFEGECYHQAFYWIKSLSYNEDNNYCYLDCSQVAIASNLDNRHKNLIKFFQFNSTREPICLDDYQIDAYWVREIEITFMNNKYDILKRYVNCFSKC